MKTLENILSFEKLAVFCFSHLFKLAIFKSKASSVAPCLAHPLLEPALQVQTSREGNFMIFLHLLWFRIKFAISEVGQNTLTEFMQQYMAFRPNSI